MGKLEAILNGESIRFDSEVTEVREFIYRNHPNIDYASLFENQRVVFFGEQHTLVSPKDDFLAGIAEMASAGVTHIGYEFLPVSMQSEIDRFYEKGDNREQLLKHFNEGKIYDEQCAERYMQIVETAKANGIKVVALDFEADTVQRQEISHTFNGRNQQWAKLMSDILNSDPNSKIAVYCGGAHAGYYPVDDRANNELRKQGHDSLTVKYCGGQIFKKDYVFGFDDKVAKSAVEAGLQRQRFVVNVDRTMSRESDLYIHLPQVEKPKLI